MARARNFAQQGIEFIGFMWRQEGTPDAFSLNNNLKYPEAVFRNHVEEINPA
jgi:hypothetical protein